jgi:hypothetical protein
LDYKHLLSFIWNLFQLLFQGAIAGLIVVWVTEWIRRRREKETLKNYATLVWTEMLGHKASFDVIAVRQQLPWDKPHSLKTTDWEQVKFNLTVISPKDFQQLTAYYQAVEQLDALFANYHGADWKTFAQPFQQTYYMCKSSLSVLDKYRIKKPNVFCRFLRKIWRVPPKTSYLL